MPILLVDRRRTPHLESHPDHRTVTPVEGSSIGIEDIRSVKEWAYLKPFVKQHKILLFQSFHRATTEAQNALLKLTEEPPDDTHIYVHTNDVDNILPTITSRCRIDTNLENNHILWRTVNPNNHLESTLLNLDSLLQDKEHTLSSIFNEADTLSKHDRTDLIEYIDTLLVRVAVLPPENKKPIATKRIGHLLEAKKMLAANTNVKLTIEHLLLQLHFVLK